MTAAPALAPPTAAAPHAVGLLAPVALVDVALALVWGMGLVTSTDTILIHAGVVAAAAAAGLVFRPGLGAEIALRAALLLLLGPLGGLVLLIAGAGPARIAPEGLQDESLTAPPRRAEALADAIRQGRRRQPLPEPPRPFAPLFREGPLDRQFRAISVISRHYRPDMLPALRVALASPVPGLRVQAAAIFARLRGHYGEMAKELLAAPAAPPAPAEARRLAGRCAEAAASGFVDEAVAARLRARQAELLDLAGPEAPGEAADPPPEASGTARDPGRPLKRHSCGGIA
ncbi:hypothetical protein LV780_19705 (plasmid) [Cereibacter azotoformans]|uniref:hypothetical protein n=1 Tax=Cereibacter azotoformans TaxID=43057 RepID=UPI000E359008|nr:hypothetical protein [Cereibacter azotoformans]AXQ95999.1 hypothetical protein D0Z66_19775 [Cereibacter sphaeroides]UIJ33067.1 hypothetical protein LV780_19705 [Cereibacter azotoformans]